MDRETTGAQHRHTHGPCQVCKRRELEIGKLRGEVLYYRRHFALLAKRIEKMLAAENHSGGGRRL